MAETVFAEEAFKMDIPAFKPRSIFGSFYFQNKIPMLILRYGEEKRVADIKTVGICIPRVRGMVKMADNFLVELSDKIEGCNNEVEDENEIPLFPGLELDDDYDYENTFDPLVDEIADDLDKWLVKKAKRWSNRRRRVLYKAFPNNDLKNYLKESLNNTETWLATFRFDNPIFRESENFLLAVKSCMAINKIEPHMTNEINEIRYGMQYLTRLESFYYSDDNVYHAKIFNGMESMESYEELRGKFVLEQLDSIDLYDRVFRYAILKQDPINVSCPRCQQGAIEKHSRVKFTSKKAGERLEQRYICKNNTCNHQFVLSHTYIKHLKQEIFKGILIYGRYAFVSYNHIAYELNVSVSTLLNWLKKWEDDFEKKSRLD